VDPYVPIILKAARPQQSTIPILPILKVVETRPAGIAVDVPFGTLRGLTPVGLVQLLVVQNKAQHQAQAGEGPTTPVLMIDRASILLQKLEVSVSDRFLLRLLAVFSPSSLSAPVVCDVEGDLLWVEEQGRQQAVSRVGANATRISCRLLELHPIAIMLGFTPVFEDEDAISVGGACGSVGGAR
jgi:hypothetical protein